MQHFDNEFAMGSQRMWMLKKNSSCGKRNLIHGSDLKSDFKGNKASKQCLNASYTLFKGYPLIKVDFNSKNVGFLSSPHRDTVKKGVSLYKKSLLKLKLITLKPPSHCYSYIRGIITSLGRN